MMQAFVKSITLDNKRARYYDLSSLNTSVDKKFNDNRSKRDKAHFYGGNGFTVGNYKPLLTELAAGFDISSLAMRGYWYDKPTAKRLTREQDADMLIAFLEQTQDAPIIGIGHSQGATATAIAAAKRPDLFSQLYLIEPVTFTKAQTLLYNLTPRRLKLNRQPFKSTITKQSNWPTVQAFYNHLREQQAYRRISDEHLQIFAEQSLIKQDDDSYALLFSPKQEMANYFGTPYIDGALKKLNAINTPYTLITGKPTLFISDKVRSNWRKFVPTERMISLPDYGHLLPIEAPKQCAKVILQNFTDNE